MHRSCWHCHLCLSLSLCSWTVLRWWPLYMIISLLIWKPPDSVYCNQLTNSFLYLVMILLLPVHCIVYSEHVNFPLKKSLHCSNIQAQTSQLAAVFYSHKWTLGDLCIKPFPISPELLHKATLMDMGISLSCRIRKRWRLWVSYRYLFCWFFCLFLLCMKHTAVSAVTCCHNCVNMQHIKASEHPKGGFQQLQF